MNFWTALLLATVFLIVAIAVLATKALFPYHRILAFAIYGLGWIPFLYSLYLKKQIILEGQSWISSFLSAFWPHMILGLVMIVVLVVFLVLFPPVKSSFIDLTDEEVAKQVIEDKEVIVYLNDKLDNLSRENKDIFAVDFSQISSEEKEEIRIAWITYIEALLELDLLKDKYKTFYQLNVVTNRKLHEQAFRNGYAAFLSQHYHTLSLTRLVDNRHLKSFLNEELSEYGIPAGMYDQIESNLTNTTELVRLNAGRAYFAILSQASNDLDFIINSHLESIDQSLGSYGKLLSNKPLEVLEKNSFNLWFPIQKESTRALSYIRTTTRDYHIDPSTIGKYKNYLQPGDILLERREWHATNVGIPGYWTHAALYIGTIDEVEEYFADIPELSGQSFDSYLKNNYPEAYEQFKNLHEDGYSRSVIESKRPGVILMSLEASTNADALGVLRVKNISRSEQFKVITQALNYLGKPYDFDFNFVTDNALVCSELVYKAYSGIDKLSIELSEVNGRLVVSPNQLAEKFDKEFDDEGSELELVLFLDGNEKERRVFEKGSDEFRHTWTRPKWQIAKDFIDLQ